MARLQILELPEGTDDGRPPFVLVIDQYVPLDVGPTLLGEPTPQRYQGIAERVGARAVLVFEETIDIPGNDVPLDPDGHPIKFRIEPDFETFREQVQGEVYAAQEAIRNGIRYVQDHYGALSTGRPTHPDGTPYTYSEITTGGWGHCDGCHTWGQWTSEKPHNCINLQAMSPTPNA